MTTVRRASFAVVIALMFASAGAGQAAEPLRKTDLIRLLTSRTMSSTQIAALVRRNCLSFTPTSRDRENLTALGADSAILSRMDDCLRARAAAAQTAEISPTASATPPVAPARSGTPARVRPGRPPAAPRRAALVAVPLSRRVSAPSGAMATVSVALKRGTKAVSGARLALRGTGRFSSGEDAEAVTDERGVARFQVHADSVPGTIRLAVAMVDGDTLAEPATIEFVTLAAAVPVAPPIAPVRRPAPGRTGFVLGMGQRGRVGEAAPLPVVFEVRDSAGGAMGDVPVSLSVVNGRLVGAQGATDSLGQVRAQVVFGERAGVPTVVSGSAAGIVRQAELYPSAGLPAQLVVLLSGNAIAGQLVVLASRPAELRVFCRDGYGNPLPLVGLRATVGDERIVRVTNVTADSLGGSLTVTAGRGGGGATNLMIQGSGLRADFSALVRP